MPSCKLGFIFRAWFVDCAQACAAKLQSERQPAHGDRGQNVTAPSAALDTNFAYLLSATPGKGRS